MTEFQLICSYDAEVIIKKANLYEKHAQQSVSIAITQETNDRFKNPFFCLFLNIEAISIPNLKSIGPCLLEVVAGTDKVDTKTYFKLNFEKCAKNTKKISSTF